MSCSLPWSLTALTGVGLRPRSGPANHAPRSDVGPQGRRQRAIPPFPPSQPAQRAGGFASGRLAGASADHRLSGDRPSAHDGRRSRLRPAHLYLLSLDPLRDGYTPARAADFLPKLLDRVKALPSVTAASLADSVPMSMIAKPRVYLRRRASGGAKTVHSAPPFRVGRDFFETIGIAVLRGRGLRQEDEKEGITIRRGQPENGPRLWKGEDPLGRRIEIGPDDGPRALSSARAGRCFRGPQPRLVGNGDLPRWWAWPATFATVSAWWLPMDHPPFMCPGVPSITPGPLCKASP